MEIIRPAEHATTCHMECAASHCNSSGIFDFGIAVLQLKVSHIYFCQEAGVLLLFLSLLCTKKISQIYYS